MERIQSCAITGRKPLFRQNIYIARPNLPSIAQLTPMIRAMLQSQWVTNFGAFHNELERQIREQLHVKHVVLCCNGTLALFLLIRALNIKGKAITTAFTFPATVHALSMAGVEPVFCDVDPDGYTLDIASVRQNMTKDISCILAVNVFGNVCDVVALEEMGKRYKVPVIYDSAHAFLCKYDGKFVGNFGHAEMFSFHATKLFSTIEGGAIATNDEKLYLRLKQLINFGIRDEESVTGIGLNGKMSEINAIFGLLSLQKMPRVLAKLRHLSEIYRSELSGVPGLKFQKVRDRAVGNNQYFPVEVIPSAFGLDRDALHAVLKRDNIVTRKYFYPPAHRYDCYRDFHFAKSAMLSRTDTLANRILCLPIYASLDTHDAQKICALIKGIQAQADQLRRMFHE